MKSAALYVRVSTRYSQNPETQLFPLRDYLQRREITNVVEYIDKGITGAQDSRPALDQLMKDAKLRRFDAVVVARFDRFARSTKHLVLALEEFNSLGIDFISLNESVDTSTPSGKLTFHVLAAVAELERDIIRERVQAGVRRAQREGKRIGRPVRIIDRERVLLLHSELQSCRLVGLQLGVGKDKIASIVKAR